MPEGFAPIPQGLAGFLPTGNVDVGARRAEAENGLSCCREMLRPRASSRWHKPSWAPFRGSAAKNGSEGVSEVPDWGGGASMGHPTAMPSRGDARGGGQPALPAGGTGDPEGWVALSGGCVGGRGLCRGPGLCPGAGRWLQRRWWCRRGFRQRGAFSASAWRGKDEQGREGGPSLPLPYMDPPFPPPVCAQGKEGGEPHSLSPKPPWDAGSWGCCSARPYSQQFPNEWRSG